MSGTRASLLRQHYAAAIAQVTLDRRAGDGDRFVHLDVPRRPDGARERSFRVFFTVLPHRVDDDTGAAYRCEFTIELYYSLASGVEDRAADDAERFWWGVDTLLNPNNNATLRDVGVMISEPSWLGIETTDRMYVASLSIVVRYRLDDALVT